MGVPGLDLTSGVCDRGNGFTVGNNYTPSDRQTQPPVRYRVLPALRRFLRAAEQPHVGLMMRVSPEAKRRDVPARMAGSPDVILKAIHIRREQRITSGVPEWSTESSRLIPGRL